MDFGLRSAEVTRAVEKRVERCAFSAWHLTLKEEFFFTTWGDGECLLKLY
jgi:hypothetical protein